MVIQRGQESSARHGDPDDSDTHPAPSTAGWSDGPWWRSTSHPRSINAVSGLVAGTKLARASAEGYSSDFFSSRGGIEAAAKHATETLSETNPTRSSDIFLAIQPIREKENSQPELFAAGAQQQTASEKSIAETEAETETITFAIYLHDPVHSISFSTLSQSIPAQWLDWLDAPSSKENQSDVPPEIAAILASGSLDPREWIAEWVEETLSLAVGIVAQRYVARRMGVGEKNVGDQEESDMMKAEKGEEEVIGAGGGESARAVGGL